MRAVLSVLVTALVGAGGAVILGEYEMVGVVAFLMGIIFGVVLAEVAAWFAKDPATELAVAVALLTQAALVWSLWIGSGHRMDLVAVEAWVATALGTVGSALWFKSAAQRERRTPTSTARTPGASPPPTAR